MGKLIDLDTARQLQQVPGFDREAAARGLDAAVRLWTVRMRLAGVPDPLAQRVTAGCLVADLYDALGLPVPVEVRAVVG